MPIIIPYDKSLFYLFFTETQEGQIKSESQDFQHDGGSHRQLLCFLKTVQNVLG